jgi:hypothetical protein
MSQITLRDLPDHVEKEIRKEAGRRGSSLNRVIISLLEKGLGISPGGKKKRDLAALAGTLDESKLAAFREETSLFDNIDAENWQK